MTFTELKHGDVFYIDGAPYQCYRVYGRLASCLVLTPDMQHIPHATDASGFGLRTTVFSDLRINENNATPAECAAHLETIKAMHNE